MTRRLIRGAIATTRPILGKAALNPRGVSIGQWPVPLLFEHRGMARSGQRIEPADRAATLRRLQECSIGNCLGIFFATDHVYAIAELARSERADRAWAKIESGKAQFFSAGFTVPERRFRASSNGRALPWELLELSVSKRARNPDCRLYIMGEAELGEFGKQISATWLEVKCPASK